MKKILIRIVGSLCILASLYVLFMTTWVNVDGIKRSDMRKIKEQITTELEVIENELKMGIVYSESLKDELKDYDLPYTSGQLKRTFRETEDFLLETIDSEVSFKELLLASAKLPGFIKDTESMLDASMVSGLIFETSEFYYAEDIEEAVEVVAEFKFVFYIVVGVLAVIILLGLVSAVTHVLNKRRFIKYFYIAIVVILFCGICIAMPLVMNTVKDNMELAEAVEDIQLKATIMPYVTLLLAAAPVVLDIIFEKKMKEKVEE